MFQGFEKQTLTTVVKMAKHSKDHILKRSEEVRDMWRKHIVTVMGNANGKKFGNLVMKIIEDNRLAANATSSKDMGQAKVSNRSVGRPRNVFSGESNLVQSRNNASRTYRSAAETAHERVDKSLVLPSYQGQLRCQEDSDNATDTAQSELALFSFRLPSVLDIDELNNSFVENYN